MKKFGEEFKKFITRGNVMDLAVGMIIGAAFTAIVTSLVNDIIMPLISIATGGVSFENWNITVGTASVNIGNFIAAILNFIIIALVIFAIVSSINKYHERKKKEEAAATPTTKVCPYCKSEIPIEATRCPHCTSEQPAEEKTEE